MAHTASIHIGVNAPCSRSGYDSRAALNDSERAAWRMGELASQAGYDSILVLRGQMATLSAVNTSLWNLSQLLAEGDTLLVTFSGHGGQVRDRDGDDPLGFDESWSLHDGELLDDQLCGCWRLFRTGVRIVVVSESCYSGGMIRTVGEDDYFSATRPGERRIRGEPYWVDTNVANAPGSPAVEPSRDRHGVRATVLMLTASGETQPAQAGLFTDCLLEIWAGGGFSGSYQDLYEAVKRRVMRIKSDQEPQLLMVGTPDADLPRAAAFRPYRETVHSRSRRARGLRG